MYARFNKSRPGAGGGNNAGRVAASPGSARTGTGRTGVGRAGQIEAQRAAQGGVPASTVTQGTTDATAAQGGLAAGGQTDFVLQQYKPGMSTGTLVALGLGGAALIFGILWAVRRRGGK